MKKWLYDKLSETDKRLDFLTERSNKMAGEYEDLLATIQAERAQSVALQQAFAVKDAAFQASIDLLNQHIADMQAAGTTPGVGIVMTPEQFATLKANAAQVITDEEAATAGLPVSTTGTTDPVNTAGGNAEGSNTGSSPVETAGLPVLGGNSGTSDAGAAVNTDAGQATV
jgi:hypothetical protein